MSESDCTCPIPSNVSWSSEGFFYDHNVKQRVAAKCPFHLRWHSRRNEFPPYTLKGPLEDARDAQFATALAEAEARGRRQGLEEADDREIERILGLTEAQVIAEIEAEGRDPKALAEAMRGQMGATFKLCEEVKRWKEEARYLRGAMEDLRTVARDLAQISLEEGDNKAAGALQYVSGFISDSLEALATAPTETQKPEETA